MTCSDESDPGTIGLSAGETVVCTFTNRKRGTVVLDKTEGGLLPLSRPFTFEIREGASTLAAGTVLATGSADLVSGEVVFGCAGVADADCRNVEGVAWFPAGEYQLCETGMLPGWYNTLTGFTPLGATPEGGDNSTECVNFTLVAGETEDFGIVDDEPPPGGDARTIGFWKNWASCDGGGNQDPVLDENLGAGLYLWGDGAVGHLVTSCAEAVDLLDKRHVAEPALVGDGAKDPADSAYNLSAQLMAVLLNFEADAGPARRCSRRWRTPRRCWPGSDSPAARLPTRCSATCRRMRTSRACSGRPTPTAGPSTATSCAFCGPAPETLGRDPRRLQQQRALPVALAASPVQQRRARISPRGSGRGPLSPAVNGLTSLGAGCDG